MNKITKAIMAGVTAFGTGLGVAAVAANEANVDINRNTWLFIGSGALVAFGAVWSVPNGS